MHFEPPVGESIGICAAYTPKPCAAFAEGHRDRGSTGSLPGSTMMAAVHGPDPQPPLFVVDRDGWLAIFESVGEAEADLESTDVEGDEYVGYDATASMLEFNVEEQDLTGASWWQRLRHQDPIRISRQYMAPDNPYLLRLLSEVLERPEAITRDELVRDIVARRPRLKNPRVSPALTAEMLQAAKQ
jgi:hypothetical protein